MYDELYETWKKEKESVEIQRLPRDFYAKLADYVRRIREEGRMLDEKTIKAKLMNREFENAKKMVEELVQLRHDKILAKVAARKTVSREVLAEEEKLYGEVFPLTEAYQTLLKDILQGRSTRIEKEEKPKKMLVRFVQEIPAIVGSDMKTYGPFKPEDIATLPIENARILIKQGVAVEVEAK
ncbi:MAG: DNA replication complex subunit Gins51 [Candidatus Bathyarchaeaceae archaeon]